jgi:hypothetical protein
VAPATVRVPISSPRPVAFCGPARNAPHLPQRSRAPGGGGSAGTVFGVPHLPHWTVITIIDAESTPDVIRQTRAPRVRRGPFRSAPQGVFAAHVKISAQPRANLYFQTGNPTNVTPHQAESAHLNVTPHRSVAGSRSDSALHRQNPALDQARDRLGTGDGGRLMHSAQIQGLLHRTTVAGRPLVVHLVQEGLVPDPAHPELAAYGMHGKGLPPRWGRRPGAVSDRPLPGIRPELG